MKPPALRLALALVAIGAGACATTPGEGLHITRVWTGFRDTASFVRLSEYSTGQEDPGNAEIVRTHPDARDGFYFSVRLTAGGANATIPDGNIVLHIVAPDASAPKTFTLPYTAGEKRSVLLLAGLTGPDWAHDEKLPLAWKFEIIDTAGRVQATRQSFLWEKRATP